MLTNTLNSPNTNLCAPDFRQVTWTTGFWKEVNENCANKTVPHLQKMFEAADISHVVENFRICANEAEGEFAGTVFGDGDFYKWMESCLYAAVTEQDPNKLQELDTYIDLIGRVQQEDGYISTKQILDERAGNKEARMGDINDFEVYNMGHLFTSACLHYRITGKTNFLNIAEKAAGYLEKMYQDAKEKDEVKTAVCPSHYMGLIELYRTTENQKFLDLAQLAIDLRDSVKQGLDDNQDRIPLKEHEKIVGHAVRATYLYAGVADLYLEKGDPELLSMLHRVWDNMVSTKIYITGGIGALYNGVSPYGNFFIDQKIHQAFGYEYQLPNVTAYNETCASVGLVMWAYRMFLIEPKSEYMDVLERAMLNVNLAAVNLEGNKFFYENPLRRLKKMEYELIWPLTRSEYILSYCCPPNLARVIMESAEYAYICSDDTVRTGMYGASKLQVKLKNQAEFTLNQLTKYPYDGRIRFEITDVKCDRPSTLCLRIPDWAKEFELSYKQEKQVSEIKNGYVCIRLEQLEQSVVELILPMEARLTTAHASVEENTAQAAVEYGPLIYCIEAADTDAETLSDLYLDPDQTFSKEWFEIKGRRMLSLHTKALAVSGSVEDGQKQQLYQTLVPRKKKQKEIRMIPYFAWDNRGFGEMKIWMPYLMTW
ncbi:MAG: glycoside hydrolase family 127 protein [Lachnospiraceae bacterium]